MKTKITRRQAVGATGAIVAVSGAMVKSVAAAGQRTQPLRQAGSGLDVPMVGIDAGGTHFRPGIMLAGMPQRRTVMQPGMVIASSYSGGGAMLQQGNTLFLTGLEANGDHFVLLVLNASTGESNWTVPGIEQVYALTDTAVIVGRTAGSGSDAVHEVTALDIGSRGDEQWVLPARIETRMIVVEDRLVLATSDMVQALDAISGRHLWERRHSDELQPRHLAAGQGVIVCVHATESSRMLALDIETGVQRWSVDTGIRIQTPPMIVNDVVYAGAPNDLITLDLATGVEIQRVNHNLALAFLGTLASAGSHILVKNNRAMTAIDRASMEVEWTYTPLYGFESGLVCTQEIALAAAGEGPRFDDGTVIEAIDLSNGEPLYELPTRKSDDVDRDVGSVHLADGAIFISTRNGLLVYGGSYSPYQGITTPFDGHSFTSPTLGYRLSWPADWEPIRHDVTFGEDGFTLASPDGWSVVTIYTIESDDYPTTQAAANYAGEFPIYFAPSGQLLVSLEQLPIHEALSGTLPAEDGKVLLHATTRLNPPGDDMRILIIAVELPGHDRYLIFELVAASTIFEGALEPFTNILGSLETSLV